MLSTNCSTSYSSSDLVYFLQATCKSDNVNLFYLNKIYLTKETIALVVVFCDIGISFLAFFSFLYLRAFQNITAIEINEQVVSASDFAVQIKNLPSHDSVRSLKADLWAWAEEVC